MNFRLIFCLLAAVTFSGLSAQDRLIRGLVVQQDSATPMPFVYIISEASGNGTMSDNNGRFSLLTHENDTLLFNYIGFFKNRVPVSEIRPDENGLVKLVMQEMPFHLAEVRVSAFTYKPYEREYMADIIDRSRLRTIDYGSSPITALYMRFSREGRQINKLARIFEQLLIEEQVEKKFNREILARLTGDDTIDFETFRKYCYYIDDQFVIEHEGVELYSAIMDCYRRWKSELNR